MTNEAIPSVAPDILVTRLAHESGQRGRDAGVVEHLAPATNAGVHEVERAAIRAIALRFIVEANAVAEEDGSDLTADERRVKGANAISSLVIYVLRQCRRSGEQRTRCRCRSKERRSFSQ